MAILYIQGTTVPCDTYQFLPAQGGYISVLIMCMSFLKLPPIMTMYWLWDQTPTVPNM